MSILPRLVSAGAFLTGVVLSVMATVSDALLIVLGAAAAVCYALAVVIWWRSRPRPSVRVWVGTGLIRFGTRLGGNTLPSQPAPSKTDSKWEDGDQLMFEGLALLDEIRKGDDCQSQASAWLDDVREFLRTHNPTAWAMFDAPTGLLPFRSTGHPRATVKVATDVDRALFLIRLTNPRRYGRAGVAAGSATVANR